MKLPQLFMCFFCAMWSSFSIAADDCGFPSIAANDILNCVTMYYERLDKRLNDQYVNVVSSPDFSQRGLFVEIGRAWLRYRDASCNEVYESVFPGAESEIERVGCLVSMTSSRLMELIYIEVGGQNDSFHNSLLAMEKISGKGRGEIMDYIEGAVVGVRGDEYFKKNCELMEILYKEDRRMCHARIKFQNM